jgi:hypothetical protein
MSMEKIFNLKIKLKYYQITIKFSKLLKLMKFLKSKIIGGELSIENLNLNFIRCVWTKIKNLIKVKK